jgi:hypothetical protein
MNRSDESSFLNSVVNELLGDKTSAVVAKQKYTVMGSHPGDGGVYSASSPEEAFALHQLPDAQTAGWTLKTLMESMKKDEKKRPFKKVEDGHWEYGDYEIKLTK